MDKETFDRILAEEGIDDLALRNELWLSRPEGNIDEELLRNTARQFKEMLPGLQMRKALNDAMAREYGWDK